MPLYSKAKYKNNNPRVYEKTKLQIPFYYLFFELDVSWLSPLAIASSSASAMLFISSSSVNSLLYKLGNCCIHVCIVLNLSKQSLPLGSAFEWWKQLNAFLNSTPHGPVAIPPKQGQFQFISPFAKFNPETLRAIIRVPISHYIKVRGSLTLCGKYEGQNCIYLVQKSSSLLLALQGDSRDYNH